MSVLGFTPLIADRQFLSAGETHFFAITTRNSTTGDAATRSRAPNGAQRNQHSAGYRPDDLFISPRAICFLAGRPARRNLDFFFGRPASPLSAVTEIFFPAAVGANKR
jgi:hypothetical protein